MAGFRCSELTAVLVCGSSGVFLCTGGDGVLESVLCTAYAALKKGSSCGLRWLQSCAFSIEKNII